MKTKHKKSGLTLDKINITKLTSPSCIIGGAKGYNKADKATEDDESGTDTWFNTGG